MKENNDARNTRIALIVALIGAISALGAAIVSGIFTIRAAEITANTKPIPIAVTQVILNNGSTATAILTNTISPVPTKLLYTSTPNNPTINDWSFNYFPSNDEIITYLNSIDKQAYSANDSVWSIDEEAKTSDNPIKVYNDLQEWGRLSGYFRLIQANCSSPNKIAFLQLGITLFKNSSGAREYWNWQKSDAEKSFLQVESNNDAGEAAHMAINNKVKSPCGDRDWHLVLLGFQRNNAVGLITSSGISSNISDLQLESIAKKYAQLVDFEITRLSK